MAKLLISFILLSILFGCNKDENFQQESLNLINNSSFEVNGQSSFLGWTGSNYSFVNDVPLNGGQWALQIEPEWAPSKGYSETFITGFSGNNTFKLSCNTKTINWEGQIILSLKSLNGSTTELTNVTFNNQIWATKELITTVSLQQSDKLIVRLSAGSTEVVNGKVLFDNIKLQKQ